MDKAKAFYKVVKVRKHPHFDEQVIISTISEGDEGCVAQPDSGGVLVIFENCVDKILLDGDDVYTLSPTLMYSYTKEDRTGIGYQGSPEEFVAIRKKLPPEVAEQIIDMLDARDGS